MRLAAVPEVREAVRARDRHPNARDRQSGAPADRTPSGEKRHRNQYTRYAADGRLYRAPVPINDVTGGPGPERPGRPGLLPRICVHVILTHQLNADASVYRSRRQHCDSGRPACGPDDTAVNWVPRSAAEWRRDISHQAIPAGGHTISSTYIKHRSGGPNTVGATGSMAPAGAGRSAVSWRSCCQVSAAYAALSRWSCSSAVSLPSANASLSRLAAASRSASDARVSPLENFGWGGAGRRQMSIH